MSKPELFNIQTSSCCHRKHYDISIYCVEQHFAVSLPHSILNMEEKSSVSLVIATRDKTSNISGLSINHIFEVGANDMFVCVFISATLVARKSNSSILLSSVQRKARQFPGMELDGSTRLLMPFTFLPSVCLQTVCGVFKADNIHNARMLQLRCDVWQNCFLAYSLKVVAVPVGSILMIAAPSKIMTSAAGLAAAAFCCGGARSSKQATRSDFVPSLVVPMCESAGGHAWFSCTKNSLRSPSRISDAMNNWENREQSFF